MIDNMKKLCTLFALLVTIVIGAKASGTTAKSIAAGDQYYGAYAEAKTNLSTNDWVSTSGSPGNSGSSYTAPSGWLEGGSGKPGYGYMNVQSGKTVTFTVTNITAVAILGAANNSTRTINLSVKESGTEVGEVATTTGNSIQVITYGTALDKTKTYSVTVSASDGNNAKFYQIRFTGAASGPTITQHPANAQYITGYAPAAMHVAATGTGTLTFMWFKCDDTNKTNPVALTDYTETTSYTPSTANAGTFYYFVRAKDDNGTTDSNVATITVSAAAAPTISVDGAPANAVVPGTEVTLTATITGNPTPTVKWFSNTTASTTGGTYTGVEGLTYTPSTATPGKYYYFAQAVNSEGDNTSEIQTIEVSTVSAANAFDYSEGKTIAQLEAAGWTFHSATGSPLSDSGEFVTLVSIFNNAGMTAPKVNSMNDNAIAFAKNSGAYAMYDLGETKTVAGISATLHGGSGSAVYQKIEYIGSDGETVKKTYVNKLDNGNWGATNVAKSEEVADVQYIKVYGARVSSGWTGDSKWMVMDNLSVSYVIPTETITPAKEYTTFSCTKALNFSEVEGLEAYAAVSAASGKVVMTKVTDIPANTGLVLKKTGTDDSYNVPVGTATSLGVDNKLVAATTATAVEAYDADNNVFNYILKNGEFHPATAGTLAAGKAYLHLDASAGQQGPVMEFDDAPTAVEAVQDVQEFNGSKVQKVIKNGQLFIGNYNVAGARVK